MSTASPTTTHATPRVADAFSFQRNLRALLVPSPVQIVALDGLRAFSVVWVTAYHVAYATQFFIDPERFTAIETAGVLLPITYGAHYAIDIFFVLSGFLIAQLLLTEKARYGGISLGRFYARRAMRLLPAYYPAMLFLYLVEPAQVRDAILDFRHLLGVDWQIDLGIQNFWANVLYFNNLLPWDRQYMGWSWTLAIEEQFYITFPLLLLFLFRRKWSLLPVFYAMLALAFVSRALVAMFVLPHSDVQNALFVKTHTRFGSIVLGVICAYHYLGRTDDAARRRFTRWLGLWPILAAVLIILWKRTGIALGIREIVIRSAHHYMVGSMVAWIVMLVVAKEKGWFARLVSRVLSNRVLFVVGQVSYSTYLLHLTIIGLVYRYVHEHHPFGLAVPTTTTGVLWWCLPIVVISCLAAVPMYLFVEHPFMVLRNIWFRRPQPPAAPRLPG